MTFWELLANFIVVPDFWLGVEMLWVFVLAVYIIYLSVKKDWFQKPITTVRQAGEYVFLNLGLSVLETDLQLDALLVLVKWMFIKEWWKQENKGAVTIVLGISTLAFLLIISPVIGDWIE
jgi:hypothetical protein